MNAAPDAASSVDPCGERIAGTPARRDEHTEEGGELDEGFDGSEHAEHADEEAAIEEMTADRRLLEHVRTRRFGAERERRKDVGADVEREHLQNADRERDLAAGKRPDDKRRELRDVVGEVIREEASNVGVGGATLLHRRDDGREVVVEEDEVGGFACHVGS